MAQPDPTADARPGWLARRRARLQANVQRLRADPTQAAPMARGWALTIWQSRGFGYYGFGYLLTVVWLEANNLLQDLLEFSLPEGSWLGWLIEGLVNMLLEALFVLFQALFWPIKLLEAFGGWGFVIIGGGWLVFAKVIRPWAEQTFPELRQYDDEQHRKAAEKADQKTQAKAARKARWHALLGRKPDKEPTDAQP